MVRHSCDKCDRPGDLVCQSVLPMPGNSDPAKYPNDPTGAWVFRAYLCRWHRGAWNRRRMDCQFRVTVLEYVDDETLLANDMLTVSCGREKTNGQ